MKNPHMKNSFPKHFTSLSLDQLPTENKDPLPVMMFIHGGAFISGDSSLYMPTKLLDRDVILVVIHYRLGTLGESEGVSEVLLGQFAPG